MPPCSATALAVAHTGVGEKSGWVIGMLAAVDPRHWSTHFGRSSRECLTLATRSDTGGVLVRGWALAAARHAGHGWRRPARMDRSHRACVDRGRSGAAQCRAARIPRVAGRGFIGRYAGHVPLTVGGIPARLLCRYGAAPAVEHGGRAIVAGLAGRAQPQRATGGITWSNNAAMAWTCSRRSPR